MKNLKNAGPGARKVNQFGGVVLPHALNDRNRPIIFLDIDEVCNSLSYRLSPAAKWIVPGSIPGVEQDLCSRKLSELDPTSTGLVLTLAAAHGAGIVIVSTWRSLFPVTVFESLFKLRGFVVSEGLVLGCTDSRGGLGLREKQCMEWREAAGHVGNYVFIDDSVMDYQDKKRLVAPSGRIGFMVDDLERASQILDTAV